LHISRAGAAPAGKSPLDFEVIRKSTRPGAAAFHFLSAVVAGAARTTKLQPKKKRRPLEGVAESRLNDRAIAKCAFTAPTAIKPRRKK